MDETGRRLPNRRRNDRTSNATQGKVGSTRKSEVVRNRLVGDAVREIVSLPPVNSSSQFPRETVEIKLYAESFIAVEDLAGRPADDLSGGPNTQDIGADEPDVCPVSSTLDIPTEKHLAEDKGKIRTVLKNMPRFLI